MNRLSDYLYVIPDIWKPQSSRCKKKEEITPFGGKEAEPVAAVQTPMTDEAVIQEISKEWESRDGLLLMVQTPDRQD